MMFSWSADTIRWYHIAVARTGYGRKLADLLEPFLKKDESILELGCGTGFLSLELARRGYPVTAVDRSALAADDLRDQAKKQHLDIPVITANWNDQALTGQWDTVLAVCTGLHPDKLARFAALCKKQLLLIDRRDLSSHVRPGEASARRRNLFSPEEYLHREAFSLEFGQPLTSLEDAKNYIRQVGGVEPTAESLALLVPTSDPEFPLYLPHKKQLELLVLTPEQVQASGRP
jgi:SAM-dependent methyltransferase